MALADEGAIPATVKLRAKFPPGLVEMTRLPGLGPKRARRLYEELGVDSLASLRAAIDEAKRAETVVAADERRLADVAPDRFGGTGKLRQRPGNATGHRIECDGDQCRQQNEIEQQRARQRCPALPLGQPEPQLVTAGRARSTP